MELFRSQVRCETVRVAVPSNCGAGSTHHKGWKGRVLIDGGTGYEMLTETDTEIMVFG